MKTNQIKKSVRSARRRKDDKQELERKQVKGGFVALESVLTSRSKETILREFEARARLLFT